MIFVGDIAMPYEAAIKTKNFPAELKHQKWFGNLEGALISDGITQKLNDAVFNDIGAIETLTSEFSFSGFALGNNHIFDAGSYEDTTGYLTKICIPFCGIGENLLEASRHLKIIDGNNELIVLNFGWEVIQCEITTGAFQGVNPLTKNHVLETIEKAVKNNPKAFVIPFMHWSYELEAEPQPFERELAKRMIDLGAAGVIGCHPHRIGGFEVYNGKPIVYSLGNWMFKQNYYHNGKLRFPDFCNQELALEWDFEKNEIYFHFFSFDRENSELVYSHSEDINSSTMAELTPFRSFTNIDYIKWYKKNHYHKRKGLPIYYWEDSTWKRNLKNKLNKIRDFAISSILKFRG